jgi:prepilin-type N-terminal cleavage/methylation domain-containing protein
MKKNNKGFTLAELLIVVAIIAVLVAIAIPVFTTQLEKSREATDIANVRSAYATIMSSYLTEGLSTSTISVAARQTIPGWQTSGGGDLEYMNETGASIYHYDPQVSGDAYKVSLNIDASGHVFPAIAKNN